MKTKPSGCNRPGELVTSGMGCWVNGVWSFNNTSHINTHTDWTRGVMGFNGPELITHAFSSNSKTCWLFQILIKNKRVEKVHTMGLKIAYLWLVFSSSETKWRRIVPMMSMSTHIFSDSVSDNSIGSLFPSFTFFFFFSSLFQVLYQNHQSSEFGTIWLRLLKFLLEEVNYYLGATLVNDDYDSWNVMVRYISTIVDLVGGIFINNAILKRRFFWWQKREEYHSADLSQWNLNFILVSTKSAEQTLWKRFADAFGSTDDLNILLISSMPS